MPNAVVKYKKTLNRLPCSAKEEQKLLLSLEES